jgi:hypothetical protein
MDRVHALMVSAVDRFERVLQLLCTGAFSVAPYPSQNGAAYAIDLVATVTDGDKALMQGRQDDVALRHLADSIGVHSGIAQVSFEFE